MNTLTGPPRIAVVIPTYNRAELLRGSLEALAGQRFPDGAYEVVVADDGSSDGTAELVRGYRDRLPLRYHFQEDLGFRAAAARNAGARLASAPVLVFIDSGTLPGPDFLRAHLDAHPPGRPRAVIGETYGYRPKDPLPGLAEAIRDRPPAEVMRRYGGIPAFLDWRHDELRTVDFDLRRRAVPWIFCWATNISLPAAEFWAAGGFDEDFRGWGAEDLELGYRLAGRGVEWVFGRSAWAIESPHERDAAGNVASNQRNALLFLAKHREPVVEVLWGMLMRDRLYPVERAYRSLLDWTRQARDLDVGDELARAAARLSPDARRVAVLGCGGAVPSSLPPGGLLVDVDRELLDRATADGRHTGQHGLGIRTALPDGGADAVIMTSRVRGLWPEWGAELLAEARRIGRTVDAPAWATVA